jgi:hypothetical protein
MGTRMEATNGRIVRRENPARTIRGFYVLAGIACAVLAAIGFQEFYLHGQEFGGVPISQPMLPFVIVHGLALTTFVALFLAQASLIASRQRRVHMTLGWSSLGLAIIIVCSGFPMAVRSVQADPQVMFFGMQYRLFLLVMLTELGCFAVLLSAAVLNRKHPARHRALMLLALLSVLPGATVRIPALFAIFGTSGWSGIFGPVISLGLIILVVRSSLSGSLDRWFAAGLGAMALIYFVAVQVASSASWARVAHEAFGV